MKYDHQDAMILEVGNRYLHKKSGNKFRPIYFEPTAFGYVVVEFELREPDCKTMYWMGRYPVRRGIFAKLNAFVEITEEQWNKD